MYLTIIYMLKNLIKNNFIPSKILFLNNNNETLIEHTENDKLISEDTNQKFIRKLIDLEISFFKLKPINPKDKRSVVPKPNVTKTTKDIFLNFIISFKANLNDIKFSI